MRGSVSFLLPRSIVSSSTCLLAAVSAHPLFSLLRFLPQDPADEDPDHPLRDIIFARGRQSGRKRDGWEGERNKSETEQTARRKKQGRTGKEKESRRQAHDDHRRRRRESATAEKRERERTMRLTEDGCYVSCSHDRRMAHKPLFFFLSSVSLFWDQGCVVKVTQIVSFLIPSTSPPVL